jgi:hypothetical protein
VSLTSVVLSALVLTSANAVRASDGSPSACAGSESGNPSLVRLVAPAYPIAAIDVRIQGVVRLALHVAPSGTVASVTECRSIPLLAPACSGAAKQWRFPAVDTSETRMALLGKASMPANKRMQLTSATASREALAADPQCYPD